MTTFQITYTMIVDAEDQNGATDEARLLLSDPRFAPTTITPLPEDPRQTFRVTVNRTDVRTYEVKAADADEAYRQITMNENDFIDEHFFVHGDLLPDEVVGTERVSDALVITPEASA